MAFILTIVGASSAATRDTDLSLSINPSNVNVGNDVTFTSRLTREDTNNGINGQTIHFFVDGTEVGTSNTQGSGSNTGTATYTYTPLTDGIKNIQARYNGISDPPGPSDGYHSSTSPTRTLTVNVNRIPTSLTVNGPSGFNGDTVQVVATLTRASNSAPISGRTVSFTVNGITAGTAVTNAMGTASVNYLINNMNAAGYPIVATFAQDNQYAGSTGSNTLTVNRIPTSLTVNGPSGFNGDTVGVTATLVRQGTSTGIGNKPVTFTVNGVSNTVNTDVNGVATWNYLISNMPAGPYTILANFAQDDYYVASSNTGTLTVNRIPTSLTVNGPSGFNGDTVGVTATLVRQGTSTGIGNKPVTFTVNGVSNTVNTDVNGVATWNYLISNMPAGPYTILANFAQDDYYVASSNTGTLTVNRIPTSLTVNGPSGFNGDTVGVTATLVRQGTSTGIGNKPVTFTVNGVSNTVNTDVNGVATWNYLISNMPAGPYTILANFAQDDYYVASSNTGTLTVNRIPTSLTVNGPSGFNGDTVGVTATLVRQGTSTGIGNKPVTFTVNGVSNTVNTDVNGVATWNYLISNMPAGPYTILANFAQDDYYVASSNTGTLTVNRIPTSLTVNGPSGFNGDTVGVTATLVRQGTSTGIGNKPVTFTVNGVSNTVNTDVNGVATWNYLISNMPAGPYTILANFAQDDYYVASSNTGTLTVNRIPTSLTVNGPSGFNGDTVGVTATLVRQGTSTGIGNKPVTFTVNGVSNTVNTDVNGVATWNYLISNMPAGPYTILANFAQDDYYVASSNTGTLTVNRIPTSLKVGDVKGNKGETVNLLATLTDSLHGNVGIVDKTVLFRVNGVNAGSATTNTSGVAVLPYIINLKGGNYPITAEFISDSIYQSSKGESTLKVPSAALEIRKTVNKNTPRVNDTVIYTLIVQNHGPDAATQVIVNEVIPTNGLKFVGVESVNYGSYANGVWTIGNLPANSIASLVLRFTVERAGSIENKAKVTSLTWDPNLYPHDAQVTIDAQTPDNPVNPIPEVNSKTIGMKTTGAPIGALLLAVLMVFVGIVMPKRKK